MVEQRSLRRRLFVGAFSLASLFIFPSVAVFATSTQTIGLDSSVQLSLDKARGHAAQGEWAQALEAYQAILTLDRHHAEARKGIQFCYRQCYRKYRITDPSFTSHVTSPQLDFRDAVKFYKDVIVKVQELYVNSKDVQLSRLFQEGLEELCLDLDDSDFRSRFLRAGLTPTDIQEIRIHLRNRYGNAKVNNLAEAGDLLRTIARDPVFRKLELSPKLMAVEFACGACNALDEYTFYLTQSSYLSLPVDKAGIGYQVFDKSIGYIRLTGFDDSTIAGLESILAELTMRKLDAVILDLRGNRGGDLQTAVSVVERFVPAPQVIASTSGKDNRTFQSTSMQVVTVPIIVLVDSNTASAAELVAGALKMQRQATLVGQTTVGKNQIQKTVPVSLPPFGAIHLTWARFHLPRMEDLSKQGGIAPNVFSDQADEQLNIALQKARSLVPMPE